MHSTKYENIVPLDGFNACVDDEALQTSCKFYSFNSLVSLNSPHALIIPRALAALI